MRSAVEVTPARRSPNRRNVIFGIVALLLLAGAAFFWWFISSGSDGDGMLRKAYLPGLANVDPRTKVLYRSRPIGEVVAFRPGWIGMQLLLIKPGLPEQRDVVTLPRRGEAELPNAGLTIRYDETVVTIERGTDRFHIDRGSDYRWYARRNHTFSALLLNGLPLGDVDRGGGNEAIPLVSGDMISIDSLMIQWNEPMEFTEVVLSLDSAEVAEMVGIPQVLGAGSTVTVSTSFGLARPTLIVETSLRREQIVAVDTMELVPINEMNIQEVVNEVATYLLSPEKMHAHPINRFQRAVASTNNALDSLSGTMGNLDAVTGSARDYLTDPSQAHVPPTTRLQATIAGLNGVMSDISRTTNELAALSQRMSATVNQLNDQTVPGATAFFQDARGAVGDVGGTGRRLDSLVSDIRDTTLIRIEQSLQETVEDLKATTRQLRKSLRAVEDFVE